MSLINLSDMKLCFGGKFIDPLGDDFVIKHECFFILAFTHIYLSQHNFTLISDNLSFKICYCVKKQPLCVGVPAHRFVGFSLFGKCR